MNNDGQQDSKYTQIYELVSKKILINKISMETLQHQILYCSLNRKLQNVIEEVATKKLHLVNELTDLYNQQLTNFTAERDRKSIEVCAKINELDTPSQEYINVMNNMDSCRRKMEDLILKIQNLQRTIPNEYYPA